MVAAMAMTPPPPPSMNYGEQPSTREHPDGTKILVLGIVGLVLCGIILGPIAWSMGNKAMAEINSNTAVTYTNKGSVNAGRICGIIATVLSALFIVIFIAASAGS